MRSYLIGSVANNGRMESNEKRRRVVTGTPTRNGAAVVERLELAELTHLVERHKRAETKPAVTAARSMPSPG